MRTSVYTFLLITCLLLTPYAVLAGTDDSGLQVFTVDFSQQLGETADIGQEDTKISQYSYNMFTSGNGICSFPRPKGAGVAWAGYPEAMTAISTTYALVRYGDYIYRHYNPAYALAYTARATIATGVSTNSDFISFGGLGKDYVFCGNTYLSTTDSFSTTSAVTLPATCEVATLWQNRFWIATGYTIYYTAAQNFENFTNSSTAGGTTNIVGITNITKLVGTRYGLYIFTDRGIFLQSGPSKAWSIEKISDDLIESKAGITVFNDVIYFKSHASQGRKIMQISGITIGVFGEIPEAAKNSTLPSLSICNSGRLLILANDSYNSVSWVCDVKNKTWTRSLEYAVCGDRYFFIKYLPSTQYSIYWFPVAEQFNNEEDDSFVITTSYLTPLVWQYKTAWLTLDGNASNRKEIDRVEIDYLGGTSTVELLCAYQNGTTSSGNTSLTAPTANRLNTYVWNAPLGRTQSNRFYLYVYSSGTQTMTTNHILKQARIYYRNIGNYKTNSLR